MQQTDSKQEYSTAIGVDGQQQPVNEATGIVKEVGPCAFWTIWGLDYSCGESEKGPF